MRLKTFHLLVLLISVQYFAFCQSNRGGKIKYIASTKNIDISHSNEKLDSQARAKVNSMLKNAEDVVFILTFSSSESSYKIQDVLQNDAKYGINISETFGGGKNIYYQSDLTEEKFYQTNIGGKMFIVTQPSNNWEILDKEDIIDDYRCIKAVLLRESGEPSNTYAWFCPDINLNIGPLNYSGLPGLIVKLDNGPITLTLLDITYTDKIEIQKPLNGERLSPEEFKERFGSVFKD